MDQHKGVSGESQAAKGQLRQELHRWVRALVLGLDKVLDKRLVLTFLQVLEVILVFRHTSYGLLLSELGGYLSGWAHVPAGMKRIGNLVRHRRWDAGLVAAFIHRKIASPTMPKIRVDTIARRGCRMNRNAMTAMAVASASCLVYPAASTSPRPSARVRRRLLMSSISFTFARTTTARVSNITIVICWRNSGPMW